jgi:5-oxopent-3-ene-1,2,5-tricarboxylate decarboxylase / 2-hydroxyhepta-2,4-diene-1,7-dioate isomerase
MLGVDQTPSLFIDRPPWRLSGVVVGAALNDPATLAALGEQVDAAPYKGAPRAPVLYVKPRHTLARAGAPMPLPPGHEAIEVGATVGLLIGAAVCRASVAEAAACITGHVLVADLGLPLASFYRPSAPARARDGSCRIGTVVAACDPDRFALRVTLDGRPVHEADTGRFARQPAQLVADVSQFMTLHPGDLLLIGMAHRAPLARAGQRVRVEGDGLGAIEFPIEAGVEAATDAATGGSR